MPNASMATPQHKFWTGAFGRAYLKRNYFSLKTWNRMYRDDLGIGMHDAFRTFFGGLDRNLRILEVGCNYGLRLLILQKMGFKGLHGIEINRDVVEFSRKKTTHLNVIEGDAFDVPFKDGYFDLVFTSGVLIHIAPRHLGTVLAEIHRCSSRFIFGAEYFSPRCTPVIYRGHRDRLWKNDFAAIYLSKFSDLRTVTKTIFPYQDDPAKQDAMFLLKKC